jgi:hypothetical protein
VAIERGPCLAQLDSENVGASNMAECDGGCAFRGPAVAVRMA